MRRNEQRAVHVSARIITGDCLTTLRAMPPESVHAIVTDPPYGYGFMGKGWDKALPDPAIWAQCLRVLRPGGHLLSFGACRMYHRLACAIEDVGFEIRDSLLWLFGQGFPKSHNLAGAWKGWGTALKPAYEPIVMARKWFKDSVARCMEQHHTGAINVDGCRIGTTKSTPASPSTSNRVHGGGFAPQTGDESGHDPNIGRWPANLILGEGAADELDAMVGERKAGGSVMGSSRGRCGEVYGDKPVVDFSGHDDAGGPSRYFYCPKATRAEREAGLAHRTPRNVNDGRSTSIDNAYQRGDTQRVNTHPTVKPLELMRWLCRLVTPPGGLIVDPFVGSGTTGIAAGLEGFDFIGCELDAEYASITRDRIKHWTGEACTDEVVATQSTPSRRGQATFDFGGIA